MLAILNVGQGSKHVSVYSSMELLLVRHAGIGYSFVASFQLFKRSRIALDQGTMCDGFLPTYFILYVMREALFPFPFLYFRFSFLYFP